MPPRTRRETLFAKKCVYFRQEKEYHRKEEEGYFQILFGLVDPRSRVDQRNFHNFEMSRRV